jgi:hypothetical protein
VCASASRRRHDRAQSIRADDERCLDRLRGAVVAKHADTTDATRSVAREVRDAHSLAHLRARVLRALQEKRIENRPSQRESTIAKGAEAVLAHEVAAQCRTVRCANDHAGKMRRACSFHGVERTHDTQQS